MTAVALPCWLVDAFVTSEPFSGNPAMVVIGADPRDAGLLQAIAGEFNQAETAFLHQRPDGDWDLRWFTPSCEVPLCGHATLAAAAILGDRRPAEAQHFRFHTASGLLTVVRSSTVAGGWDMDFPAELAAPCAPPDGLADALGALPFAAARNRMDLLIELVDADTVRSLRPDLSLLSQVATDRGIIVTAQEEDPADGIAVRFFAPRAGITEDHATGSAACALAPWWSGRIPGGDPAAPVIINQHSARGARIVARVDGGRVILTGTTRITLRGDLELPC
jgi:PhzF family phenazine biosynthesis protein